ncbi:hypothetical protein Gorai_021188, partial [Gossypium raimondii]|nr:hypothetical protein [Gossypium raimondii]
ANPLGSNSGVGQATKKVRTKSNLPPDTDDLTNVAMVEDFAFMDGDVITEVVDGILSITFSNQTIGPVVKLDVHIVSARRGRFVWLAVCVDFRKPLVSKGRRGTLRDVDAGGGNVFLAILLQSSDITTIYVYSGSRTTNFLSAYDHILV